MVLDHRPAALVLQPLRHAQDLRIDIAAELPAAASAQPEGRAVRPLPTHPSRWRLRRLALVFGERVLGEVDQSLDHDVQDLALEDESKDLLGREAEAPACLSGTARRTSVPQPHGVPRGARTVSQSGVPSESRTWATAR